MCLHEFEYTILFYGGINPMDHRGALVYTILYNQNQKLNILEMSQIMGMLS